jgi:oligopeptide transport system substrate-binding protein
MAFTLAACGGEEKPDLSVNLTQEPPEMNSILTTSTGSGNVLRHIMEGLVELDENDIAQPGMAESWDISDDKMTYTFHLREGAKWTNGEEVTANDFVFSWNQLFTPKTGAPYAGTWAPLIQGAEELLNAKDGDVEEALKNVGYKAIDDYTLEVKLTGPYDYFIDVVAFYSFLPVNEKGYKDMGGQDKYAQEADAIVTNGAFTMEEWSHEDRILLKKNPDYWRADDVKLDTVEMRMISDANAALNEFKAGDIDMTNVNGEQRKALLEDGQEVLGFADGGSWYLEYNTTLPGLDNAKVRKALTLAVDAQKYVEKVVLNDSVVANSLVPPAIGQGKFHESVGDLLNRPTNGDFSEAVKLLDEGLAEAGINKADFKPEMIIDDTTTANTYGAYIKEQFKTVLGIELEVSPMTYNARLDRMESKDFSIVLAGWGPDYNDPMTFLDLFVSGAGNNHTSYSNPEYDNLVAAARMEADTETRNGMLKQIEEIIAKDCPIGVIYYRTTDYVLSEGVTGVTRTAFTDIDVRFADKADK